MNISITCIRWRDAAYGQAEVDITDTSLSDLWEVGFLLREDKDSVTVSMERDDDAELDLRAKGGDYRAHRHPIQRLSANAEKAAGGEMISANDFVPATPEAICPVCGRASGYLITRDNRHTCYLRCVHAVSVGEHGGQPCVIFRRNDATQRSGKQSNAA